MLLVSGFVRNDVTLALDFAEASGGDAADARLRPAAGQAHRAPTTFRRCIAPSPRARSIDPDDPDAEFDFGMARILDGIAALIASKAAAPPSRRRR